jgi:diguanylate cyclase (GGDEF)-like protein
MTVEVEQTTSEAHQRGGVSGAVVAVLIGRVHAHGGDIGVAQALALAGDDRPFSTLADLNSWTSPSQAVALFNAAALVTGDGLVGIHVGEELLYRSDGTDFVSRLWALGSPEAALKHVSALVGHFETESEAVALEVAADHALIQLSPRSARSRHAHLCEMTRGLLAQVPALYGLGPAVVSETECAARGGRFCLYALSWEDPTDRECSEPVPASPDGAPLPRVVGVDGATGRQDDTDARHPPLDSAHSAERSVTELRGEVDRMRVLLTGAFDTAAELLGDDPQSLLTQIAAGADAVISAHRYLLMVRVRPEAPLQLHFRGLDVEEAQRVAAELWRGHPDDGSSRLIVDIATPQHLYGRLAVILPPGATHPSSESKALRLYAEYAAITLDVFRALTDATQSDATTRTLLALSEAVSRVTTPAELVKVVADAVPTVTDCDHSTVYLWAPEGGRLLLRAASEGLEMHPDGVDEELPISPDAATVEEMVRRREVLVLDASTEDPVLSNLLEQSHATVAALAPLVANGELLGVITANFDHDAPATVRHAGLHERLSGVADQAATALQNLALLEKVSHMAWHDALTGLPNRRLFEDRVEQELVRSRRVGEPVCMFFVDLDHFKTVNDTLGHTAGDDLIRQVSQRLVNTVRRQDTVARVGGDEFAILLPGLSDQLSIDELAQRSLEAMSTPFDVFGEAVATSASIGIAMAPDHGDSYDELLSRADEAMYRAKSFGRNAFQMYSGSVVTTSMGRLAVDEDTLKVDLIHALDYDEFIVLYQPYIDLRTTRVVGVEALIRWDHPTLGLLEPSSFISLAERSAIIVALDSWVLKQACRQLRTWLDRGLRPLRLSVNLASRDLSDPELFDNVDRTLAETGIDPSLLELEITERVILDRFGPAKENIERLRRLGVRFTIDDFGTGNSSLSRIGSFPVSTLKIDQSFVQVLGPDGDNNSLVSAIISMADRLGLDCVAEGVETSLQSRMLLQRGCTTAQGYFFSPPLPAQDIEQMMANIATVEGPLTLGDSVG